MGFRRGVGHRLHAPAALVQGHAYLLRDAAIVLRLRHSFSKCWRRVGDACEANLARFCVALKRSVQHHRTETWRPCSVHRPAAVDRIRARGGGGGRPHRIARGGGSEDEMGVASAESVARIHQR
eukprot:825240-Prymnesium_polylepis.1